ncbi:MAG TPA: 16S rRNA (cytosine(967)-C(5))-methyltransferase RsmB [Bacillota bacterium]|nr:16S rRNA (cytosine(967)-C(5))-methyltransferase RsmB [Bacillota bacterium]
MFIQQEKGSARSVALEVLVEVEENKAFSNLQLNAVLRRQPLERRDIGLATELVYGTLSRLNTLDWMVEQLSKKPISKLEPWVRCLLRLSIYQLAYLDRIPDRAVIHEAVEMAKNRGHQGISGLVNGILRNYQRTKEEIKIPAQWPKFKKIAIEYSHPEWLVKRWLSLFGPEQTIEVCKTNNMAPFISLRSNRLKITKEELMERLGKELPEAEFTYSHLAPDGITVGNGGGVASLEAFRQGLCTIQDESSMLVALALRVVPGMTVLDTCAAPGGKTTHVAERMENKGSILALDIHDHKLKLIDENAKRLGVGIIQTKLADARMLPSDLSETLFDRVLVDAPCSGFGVIRRKPDLKWQKRFEDIAAITETQQQILNQAARWVKPGGKLVYSTCTIDPEENNKQLNHFIQMNPNFRLDPTLVEDLPEVLRAYVHKSGAYVQILPHYFGSDGFFISRVIRIH